MRYSTIKMEEESEECMKQLVKDSSGVPSRHAACDWFSHAPLKQTDQASDGVLPPKSQIPGLSDLSGTHEATNDSRRHRIMDSDSDYVKLAKQGGRPDLLKPVSQTVKKSSSASYSLPDWYTHESVTPAAEHAEAYQSNPPDYMVHMDLEEDENEDKYEGKRGPFDFDQKSVWQRDTGDNEKENLDDKKQVKLPAIKQGSSQETNIAASGIGPASTRAKEGNLGKKCVFPPMPISKNRDNTNFSKLMSNGYGDDWFQNRDDLENPPQGTKPTKDSEMDPLK